MINVFNRRELVTTFSEEQKMAIADALGKAGIKYSLRTRKNKRTGGVTENEYTRARSTVSGAALRRLATAAARSACPHPDNRLSLS